MHALVKQCPMHVCVQVRDIRTMAGLRSDCATDIKTLCKGVVPGEGRVIACLRDARANITDELCRRQVLRLLGFVVEDHRMDYELMSACKPDVQQFCAGVVPGDGLVHDCLRRSRDHVSHECAAAEEKVEMMEHEDVRLNPKIQRCVVYPRAPPPHRKALSTCGE